jgi:hypothetical protein
MLHNTEAAIEMNARYLPLLLLAVNLLYAAEPVHILVCGSAQVLEGAIEQSAGKQVFAVKWFWRPELSRGLPVTLKSNFAGTDECKPAATIRSPGSRAAE